MNATHSRASKCTFGKENRDRSPLFKEMMSKPGVGAYNGSSDMLKSGPKIGFCKAKRPELVNKKDLTPAPGQYNTSSKR